LEKFNIFDMKLRGLCFFFSTEAQGARSFTGGYGVSQGGKWGFEKND